MTHHGPDYDRQKWGTLAKTALRLGEYFGIKYAFAVIAVSAHIQQLLFEKYESIAVNIPNGITPGDIRPPGNFLRDLGLEKGKYFLAVGRLVPEKGFHILLSAYSKLDTDWKLVIAGGDDHTDAYSIELKKEAAGMNGLVMAGFQTGRALSELYSNAGLFVLPSTHEGLPLAALEAIGYRLPILVSDIAANREFAAECEMFPVGDARALADQMNLASRGLYPAGSSGEARDKWPRLETKFNWDHVARMTGQLYEAVAEKSTAAGVWLTRK
jgi:glycosyltransferase involved in cell wall biosynthesis